MFSFERLITPKVINGLYIITVVALIAVAIIFLFYRSIYIAIACVVSAIFIRIFFESIMVAFKNNEYLRRIADAIEKK